MAPIIGPQDGRPDPTRAEAEFDSAMARVIRDPRSEASTAIQLRGMRNILDFDVKTGSFTSQTGAIQAALDAHPGKTFYFPPGDYRLDTALIINHANSLILDDDARIYAAAAMPTLIHYAYAGTGYAEDKAIIGGALDGNLQAETILYIRSVLHMTLSRTVFRNGIHRGLVTGAGPGAELFAYDLRFVNTGTTNVYNNIAIEANMSDCHFRDVVVRDWTVGVKDTGANRWNRIHPWISPDSPETGQMQMTCRYPLSIAFDITGPSDLVDVYSDTYRTAYRIRRMAGSYTAPPLFNNCSASWASSAISNSLANEHPGAVFDNEDGVGAICDRTSIIGHATARALPDFLTGPTANFTARNSYSYGFVEGPLEYIDGVAQGVEAFTPVFRGTSGDGEHTYTVQDGTMLVSGITVTYSFHIKATLDASTKFAGSLRIEGLPLPAGAGALRDGVGTVGLVLGAPVSSCVLPAGTSPFIVPYHLCGSFTSEIAVAPLRGNTIEILGTISSTCYSGK